MNYCFVWLMLVSNVVPDVIAVYAVTVKSATHKLGENALMELTYTLQLLETFQHVSWFKSNAGGDKLGLDIINNRNGNTEPNGRYSLSSNGDLKIASVEVDDTGYYSCQVYTDSDNANGFNLLRVYYLWTPTLEFTEKTISEKETLTFMCRLPDGIPTFITNTWIKDGGVLDVSDTEKYLQYTTLEISRVNEMDIGDYHCRAENSAYSGNEGKLSNTKRLLVLVYPATQVIGENALMKLTYTLQLGEKNLYVSWFECEADGDKKGDALITNINGKTEPKGRYSLSSDGDLMISSVTVDDTGYYRCEVVTTSGIEYGFNLLTVYYRGTPTSEPKNNTVNMKSKEEYCSDSCTSLVVGMTILGIVIGIVLSSSAFGIYLKTRTSSSKTYMEYRSQQTTNDQTYEDLNTNDDKRVCYVNVKRKKEKM